ncbi:hypothetical protein N431DRAFT_331037 [Stipitochalara longipes BDJ]|nr:hypothetical protein N431DRAFT_331037 [Stipitochalara longipes BDJ]
MSSGFVSGGTADAPIERSDEWLAAQKELEANRQRKAEQARQADGRSLYETLEANKAAKQEAFEEANRLKNQFRALDQDEVEFLDSVLESTRKEEDRVKRETAEGLALFRQQQEEADKKARRGSDGAAVEEGPPTVEEESWGSGGRKRKRMKDKEGLKGVKIRRSSISTEPTKPSQASPPAPSSPDSPVLKEIETAKTSVQPQKIQESQTPKSRSLADNKKPPGPVKGVLVNYGSDEDEDW